MRVERKVGHYNINTRTCSQKVRVWNTDTHAQCFTALWTSSPNPHLRKSSLRQTYEFSINPKSLCCQTQTCTSLSDSGLAVPMCRITNADTFLLTHFCKKPAKYLGGINWSNNNNNNNKTLSWSGLLCSDGWRGHHWNKQGREQTMRRPRGDYNNTDCMS